MSVWNVFVEPETEWIALPTDPQTDLDAHIAEVLEAAPRTADRQVLDRQLRIFAERAIENAAVSAAVLPSPEWREIVAMLEIYGFPAGPDGFPTDLDDLAVALHPEFPTWLETTRLQLPAGEVVRMHMIDAEPDGPGGKQVVESVTVAVPTPTGEQVAVVLMTWSDLALAEEMLAIADDVAQTLRFEQALD